MSIKAVRMLEAIGPQRHEKRWIWLKWMVEPGEGGRDVCRLTSAVSRWEKLSFHSSGTIWGNAWVHHKPGGSGEVSGHIILFSIFSYKYLLVGSSRRVESGLSCLSKAGALRGLAWPSIFFRLLLRGNNELNHFSVLKHRLHVLAHLSCFYRWSQD